MGKPGAYLELERHEHEMRGAPESLGDYAELAIPLQEEVQRLQASRCMYCGVAFCQAGTSFGSARPSGCPLHNLIPEWNDLVYRGLWDEAYERLSLTNPFPEFTGRVCPALCEAACNLGLHDGPTTIRDNERAISDHAWASKEGPLGFGLAGADKVDADKTDADTPYGNKPDAGKPSEKAPSMTAIESERISTRPTALSLNNEAPNVAVVGSGPAGLCVAWELSRRGAKVSVVERDDRAGGLLMYGIPNMKLPKDVVERRVALMQSLGIEMRCGVDASSPAVAKELLATSDAVVVAAGARTARTLEVPGSKLDGVVLAVDYLRNATKALLDGTEPDVCARGRDVVVVGGGDTGTDCVATALRQGATSVTQLEFLCEPPRTRPASNSWPEWPNVRKDDYGQREAAAAFGHDPRQWGVETLDVLGEDGKVSGLRVVSLDWSAGRPRRIEGSERVLPAQLVLLAMGFVGPEGDVFEALGVSRADDPRGLPVTANTLHRAVANHDVPVFVAGDCRNGSSLVVSAIADGLACAAEVATSLGI